MCPCNCEDENVERQGHQRGLITLSSLENGGGRADRTGGVSGEGDDVRRASSPRFHTHHVFQAMGDTLDLLVHLNRLCEDKE